MGFKTYRERFSEDQAQPVSVIGAAFAEQLTQSDEAGGELTFEQPIRFIEVFNRDDETDLVLEINGKAVLIPPMTVWGPARVAGEASEVVIVTATTDAYIVSRYE